MKRVEAVNITGIVFNINNDAYDKLNAYLNTLTRYFRNEQGGPEIIIDIEARIAELFTERPGGTGQPVSLADVTRVIETLGTPEDIAGMDSESERNDAQTSSEPTAKPGPKRLYRDPDERYLGGVCAGIAARLGIDPVIVRAIFIVATICYGVSIMFYCLLWVIIPKAKTTAQKLEMRGEPVTISNIEKNIKESLSDSSLKRSFRDFLNEAGEFLSKVFKIIGRIIGIFIGIILFCFGLAFAVADFCLIFGKDSLLFDSVTGNFHWGGSSFNELAQVIVSPASYCILWICAIVILTLTAGACLFWGAKLTTGFKIRRKPLHIVLFIVWMAAIATTVVVCAVEARRYLWFNEAVEIKQIASAEKIYLAAVTSDSEKRGNTSDVFYDKEKACFYRRPNLNIRKSDDGNIKLSIEKESQGENKAAAYRYAENIVYNVEVRDSLVTFDPYFAITSQDKWRFQSMNLDLYIPVGTVIVVDKTLYNDRTLGSRFRRLSDNGSNTWVMTERKGLQPLGNKE